MKICKKNLFLLGKIELLDFLHENGIDAISFDRTKAENYANSEMKRLGIVVTGSDSIKLRDIARNRRIVEDLLNQKNIQ